MNDFTAIMRKRTDSELLAITTTQRADYQPEALLAAEAEWKSRNLTEQQVADAQHAVDLAQREEERKIKKRRQIEKKAADFAESVHPLTGNTTDKIIKILTLVLTFDFILELWQGWHLLKYVLLEFRDLDFSVLTYLIALVLMPIALYSFWKIQKYGWIMLVMWMTFLVIGTFTNLAISIKLMLTYGSDSSISDALGFGPSLMSVLGRLAVFGAILFLLNKQQILERYRIDRRTQLLAIGLTLPFILASMVMGSFM